MTHKEFNREISLNEKQWERFKEWAKRVTPADYECEDCSCSSPFTFKFYLTGLGPNITVDGFGKTLSLTLDDYGEFC